MNLFELYAKISVDDTNFKKSMENAQKVSKNVATAMQQLQSPLDKAKNTFNAIAHPIETAKANFEKLKNATESLQHPIETLKNKVNDAGTALETKRNKLSVLASGYDSAKKKVADLTKEFNKSAKESGTSSQKTQELAKKLNEAEKEAEEAKKELDDYSASVSKAGKNSDSASKGVGNFASKLGKGLATAGKVAGAALGVAAAGITALTTAAVNNYAEYEQLVGGVETLFGKSADTVMKYAENAYKTAGLSANEYMATVTSFSASLLQSVGGDTDKAADYANRALTDMSDNANKMGTSMELIQNAYNGFAKANYTMLDNLKLGYGGTKEEMARLIKEAAAMTDVQKELGIAVDATDMSFGNIVNAISVVQKNMKITGTTALEAGRTISGSVGAMKSAWANLVTGFADGNADIEGLINNLVTTIVGDGTENNLGVIGNVLPAIERALGGIGTLIEGAVPKIVDILPGLVSKIAPSLISASTNLVKSLTTAIPSLLQTIIDALIENAPALIVASIAMIEQISKGVLSMLPDILQLGIDLMFVLIDGITSMIGDPAFVQTIVDVVLKIVEILTNPDTIVKLLNAAVTIIIALAKGLIQALPQLLAKVPEIINNLVTAFGQFLKPIIEIGKNIIDGIKQGISNAWNNLVKWFEGLFDDLIGIAKRILGIASPSKVFKKIGGFTAEGFGAGFEDEFAHVKDDMEDALKFDDASVGINASIRKVGAGAAGMAYGGSSFGDVYINIDGARYDDPQSLAVAVAEELQNMTDRRLAVYA